MRGLPVLTGGEFTQFQRLIYREAGIFLSNGKEALLAARLGRRVRELSLPSFGAYYRHVVDHDDAELVELLDAITTNETHFFREPAQFDFLETQACPQWRAEEEGGLRQRRVRLWSAACSTGEEPYSIAMVLLDRLGRDWDLGVTASDISTRALKRAREATWPIAKLGGIPERYLKRHMLRGTGPETGRAKVAPLTRSVVSFERMNLRGDVYPVGDNLDAIFCRNVLIYFDAASRTHVLAKLVEHLAPGGYLFLGHAESLTGSAIRLQSVMPSVYRKPVAGA